MYHLKQWFSSWNGHRNHQENNGPHPKTNQNLWEISTRTLTLQSSLPKQSKDNWEILAKGGQELATKSLTESTSDRWARSRIWPSAKSHQQSLYHSLLGNHCHGTKHNQKNMGWTYSLPVMGRPRDYSTIVLDKRQSGGRLPGPESQLCH